MILLQKPGAGSGSDVEVAIASRLLVFEPHLWWMIALSFIAKGKGLAILLCFLALEGVG